MDMALYAAIGETGVWHTSICKKGLIYRYDQETKSWKNVFVNCTPLKRLDHNATSHGFIQRLVSEINPCYLEKPSYQDSYYPFVQVTSKDKTWSVGKIMSFKRLEL